MQARPRERQQAIDIEMPLQLARQFVERGIDRMIVVRAVRARTDPRQHGRAQAGCGEQAVAIGAEHTPVGVIAPSARAPSRQAKDGRARPGGFAHVHLVPLERRVQRHAAHAPQRLFRGEHGFHVEQAQPGDVARIAFDPQRIGDPAAKHLVSAANPQHRAAAPVMGRMSMSQPCARRNAMSAIVAFDPGSTISAAWAGIGVPGGTIATSTSGSCRKGSRSSKLAMRGRIGQATSLRPA
jgi:hypothetical protein